jgi:hypothetical protein
MEYWVSEADGGLILFSELCHPDKKHISFRQPQYSITPVFHHSIPLQAGYTAQPIPSDLAQRTRFSMLD